MPELNDSDIRKIVDEVVSRLMNPTGNLSTSVKGETNLQASSDGLVHNKVIAIGADHGGFELKAMLIKFLNEKGYQVDDRGTYSTDAVDYPDFAYAVAERVSTGQAWRGIVIDGAGIGSNMAANKVKRVRSAMCYDHASAHNSREHNDANVLSLGAGLLGPNLVKQIVTTFLETKFGGGRHARRVDKIMEIEKNHDIS